jgi:hypothetical protein
MVCADADPTRRPRSSTVAGTWALLGIPSPLPLVDGLLAATAKVHGLTWVTRNVADVAPAGVTLLDPFSSLKPDEP